MPPGTAIEFGVEELLLPGAEVGVRITMDVDAGGVTAVIFVEINAIRMGDCTVYWSSQTFTDPFDPNLAEKLFNAALTA